MSRLCTQDRLTLVAIILTIHGLNLSIGLIFYYKWQNELSRFILLIVLLLLLPYLVIVFSVLPQVHFLYQYSLKFFLGIFESSLTTDRLTGVKGHNERLQVISTVLFQTAFNRTARGMLHRDQLGLALHLSRIELKQSAPAAQQYEAEFQQFLHSQVKLMIGSLTNMYI